MTARRPLAVANWKMNGDLSLVEAMASRLNKLGETKAQIVICPSFPFLAACKSQAQGFKVGAQNMSEQDSGAFTGEVSAQMLTGLEIEYVIIGHSERRAIYGEDDSLVAQKFAKALSAGLTPILCVGETIEQREAGDTEAVVSAQVKAVIDTHGVAAFDNAVIAYEPVWAIGTGKTATAEMAQEVHQFIRALVAQFDEAIAQKLPILYGGSVNSSNSQALFAQPDIDGGLVGGASLKVEDFAAICQSF